MTALVEARVRQRRPLAADTWLFELQACDGRALAPAAAGAHVDVELADGTLRQYSLLAGIAEDPGALAIAVKRDGQGRGGSRRLCDEVRVGDRLRVSAPRNHFALVEDAPHTVLVAGGIGITPIWSMTRTLLARGASWELHYACRSRAEAALLQQLEPLPQVRFFFDDEHPGQRLDLAAIVAAAPAGAHLYCCGPAPMLDAFENAARHWPSAQRHVERFAAAQAAARSDDGFCLQLARTGAELHVAPGRTVLEVLREAGVEVPSSCEQGICGACETRVLEGEVDHRDSILSPTEQASHTVMMICCSGSRGPRLVLDL